MLRGSKHRQTHLLHVFGNHTCDSQNQKTLMFPSGSVVYLQQGWPVPNFKALFVWQDSEGV